MPAPSGAGAQKICQFQLYFTLPELAQMLKRKARVQRQELPVWNARR
jgi:hypothetical protein